MSPRTRSARGEGDALRSEIVGAAEKLLLSSGSDEAVSIRAVATAVGVTAPSIYRHFADKDQLILAVCESQFGNFNEVMLAAARGATTPMDELQAMGEAYIQFGLDHPEAYAVMFMRPPSEFLALEGAGRPEAYLGVVDLVKRAVEAGQMETKNVDLAAQVIWAAVHGLTSLMIAKPDFPWKKRKDLTAHILHGAVAPFLPVP